MAKSGEVYIEFIPQGRYVKVCAVCADTGLEVSMVGDPSVGQKELARLAHQKLEYVRRKYQENQQKPPSGLIV